MPAVNPNANQTGSGGGSVQRTTFRPPWVKEGPNPLPMPSAPWTPRRRESNPSAEEVPKVNQINILGMAILLKWPNFFFILAKLCVLYSSLLSSYLSVLEYHINFNIS